MVGLGIAALFSLFNISPGENPIVNELGLKWTIIIGCLFVPLFETLLLQSLPIEFVLWIKGNCKILALLLSAILFALTHWFDVFYIIYASILGLLFAGAYIICRDKKDSWYAYFITTIIHSLWNIIATVDEFYLN